MLAKKSQVLNLTLNSNKGIIKLSENNFPFSLKNSAIIVQSSMIYCSNAFAVNSPPLINLNLTNSNINNSDYEYSYYYDTESVASNVLKIDKNYVVGIYHRNELRTIRYEVYDSAFDLLAGNILIKISILFVNT